MYTIKPGAMAAWLEEWGRLIAPLRRRNGFEIVGSWTAEPDQFVWILRYTGPKTWEDADAAYYASPERAAMQPDPARHIAKSEHWLMSEVPAPQIPADMNAFNRKVIEDFRANRGQLTGPLAGRTLMLLTTTGAKSGKERTAVLGFGKDGDRYVVIASNNGAPSHPAWYLNLQARPIATVEVGPDTLKVRARTARPEEREQLKRLVPYIEQQQTLTTREIPIVVLER